MVWPCTPLARDPELAVMVGVPATVLRKRKLRLDAPAARGSEVTAAPQVGTLEKVTLAGALVRLRVLAAPRGDGLEKLSWTSTVTVVEQAPATTLWLGV